MRAQQILRKRAVEQCELCGLSDNLVSYAVDGDKDNAEKCVLTCGTCHN